MSVSIQATTPYLLRNGRVVDRASGRDEIADLLIADGAVAGVGPDLAGSDAEVVDVGGAVVAPGLVDLHTHVREPGREDEETIASGREGLGTGPRGRTR